MTKWRRQIHRKPEFGFEEEETSALVASKLSEYGLEVHTGIGGTGVVGILKKGGGPASIGLRADMDALKIKERNDFAHVSEREGLMHACGHDGHTTMLLGAASVLAREGNFDGTVYFIFQPAEEHGLGAKAMIADGLFERWQIDEVYAMHNLPGLPEGSFATRAGSIMASESSFSIEILASGGHAALPHMGTDPIVVGAQVILALQQIVSRNLSAIGEPAVVSVTEVTTNGTVNVIPSSLKIKGDTRCFTDAALRKIEETMERIVAGQCAAAGVRYQYEFRNTFVSTINAEGPTKKAVRAAVTAAGEENVNGNCQPFTISEDFAFLLREKPGCYILIGNGEGRPALHNPHYDFNDAVLERGVQYWKTLVEQQLSV